MQLENIRRNFADHSADTPLEAAATKRSLDKFRGCLLGGAAGDALGYTVEFMGEGEIFTQFGEQGIQAYCPVNGVAQISDDTQMTMFTATGLMMGETLARRTGKQKFVLDYICRAYGDWYNTQTRYYPPREGETYHSWLYTVPELFDRRAPGNTCMNALLVDGGGSIEAPLNESKGCGGVMRVAPVGLFCSGPAWSGLASDLMAADAAAVTHGHGLGYMPAAMLAHIVRLVSHSDEITLKEAVVDSIRAVAALFSQQAYTPVLVELVDRAVTLAESDLEDLDAIHQLGAGWVGEEALAIAVYCALKYSGDFDKAMIAAVNHGGDSDSTGAIAGNILGAYLGLSGIPEKYLEKLELRKVLTELADDLYFGCQLRDGQLPAGADVEAWERKYTHRPRYFGRN